MKKNLSTALLFAFLILLNACDDSYKLKLTSPKIIQVNQNLDVSVTEKENKPIDSVWYYLDGHRVEGTSMSIADKKLGTHAISATVFYGDKQKKLTNTVIFLADSAPEIYSYEIINEYPHDKDAFTQGLEYHKGYLYESTGKYGKSSLRKVNLETGEVLLKKELDQQYFGEGMTIYDTKIYMLTWRSMKGFVFNMDTFEQEGEFKYNQSKEGWGLTHSEDQLIKTDGTDKIWFLNPETMAEEGSIEAYTNKRKAEKLNELEYINGKIYANIWQQNSIVIIDPVTGKIEGIANLKGLQDKVGKSGDDQVLNGIAWDQENERLFVTGKNWDKLFEIKLNKK